MIAPSPKKKKESSGRRLRESLTRLERGAVRDAMQGYSELLIRISRAGASPEKTVATLDLLLATISARFDRYREGGIGLRLPLSTDDHIAVRNAVSALSILLDLYRAQASILTDRGTREDAVLANRILTGEMKAAFEVQRVCALVHLGLPRRHWMKLHRRWLNAGQLVRGLYGNLDPAVEACYKQCILLGLIDPHQTPMALLPRVIQLIFDKPQLVDLRMNAGTSFCVDSGATAFALEPLCAQPGVRLDADRKRSVSNKVWLDVSRFVDYLKERQTQLRSIVDDSAVDDVSAASAELEFEAVTYMRNTLEADTPRDGKRKYRDMVFDVVAGSAQLLALARNDQEGARPVRMNFGSPESGICERKLFIRGDLVNESDSGIRMSLMGFNNPNIRVGDVVSYRERDADDSWKCGIVVWRKLENLGHIEIGLSKMDGVLALAKIYTSQYKDVLVLADGSPDPDALILLSSIKPNEMKALSAVEFGGQLWRDFELSVVSTHHALTIYAVFPQTVDCGDERDALMHDMIEENAREFVPDDNSSALVGSFFGD